MTIEFQAPYKKVSDEFIDNLWDEILQLSYVQNHIVRAEILLIEDKAATKQQNKICQISLTDVFGEDFFVHTQGKSFDRAAKEAMGDLKQIVEQQVEKEKEHLDEITVIYNYYNHK